MFIDLIEYSPHCIYRLKFHRFLFLFITFSLLDFPCHPKHVISEALCSWPIIPIQYIFKEKEKSILVNWKYRGLKSFIMTRLAFTIALDTFVPPPALPQMPIIGVHLPVLFTRNAWQKQNRFRQSTMLKSFLFSSYFSLWHNLFKCSIFIVLRLGNAELSNLFQSWRNQRKTKNNRKIQCGFCFSL